MLAFSVKQQELPDDLGHRYDFEVNVSEPSAMEWVLLFARMFDELVGLSSEHETHVNPNEVMTVLSNLIRLRAMMSPEISMLDHVLDVVENGLSSHKFN